MIKDYIILLLSVVLLALNFAATKVYQTNSGTSLRSGLKFNIITGGLTAIIFFIFNGFKCDINMFSAAMAAAVALFCALYTVIGFKIMEKGQMALYTIFLMTGGMSVPYIWGLIFLNEPFSALRTVGLLIIAVSIIISNSGSERPDNRQILMCIAIFILNGFVSVASKEHQINSRAVSSTDFLILNSAAKVVICAVLCLFTKKSETEKISVSAVWAIGAATVCGGVSYLLQLIGAENLPATVLYPIITGGSIILTAAAGRLFFKEKPNRRTLLAIALCFFGTCMFL